MACEHFEGMDKDGKRYTMTARVSRGRRSRCPACGAFAEPRLCDGLDQGAKKTCDARICASCSAKGTRRRPPLQPGQIRPAGSERLDFCARHRHQAVDPPAAPPEDTTPAQASLDLNGGAR